MLDITKIPKRNLNGWIKCYDELPPYDKRVLIYIEKTDEVMIGALKKETRKNGTINYAWELDNCNEYGTDSPYLSLEDVDFWQLIPITPDPRPRSPDSYYLGNTALGASEEAMQKYTDNQITTGGGASFGWEDNKPEQKTNNRMIGDSAEIYYDDIVSGFIPKFRDTE